MKELEKDIEHGILHYLSAIPSVYVWKQNSIGVFDSKRGIYRPPNSPYIIKGVSDIIGIVNYGLCQGINHNCGRFIAIEVKTPQRKGNVSEDQSRFLRTIREFGGIAFVATSIKDVKEVLHAEGIINHLSVC